MAVLGCLPQCASSGEEVCSLLEGSESHSLMLSDPRKGLLGNNSAHWLEGTDWPAGVGLLTALNTKFLYFVATMGHEYVAREGEILTCAVGPPSFS